MASHSETGDDRGAGLHARLQCQVVTPEKTLFDKTVDFVALPLYDGELGILPGRSPLIGRLGYGELRTRTNDAVERYFIDGGFAQIRGNLVTILTSRALPASQIDSSNTAEALEKAEQQPAHTDEAVAEKTKAVARLRAMLRVSGKH
ncbi:MAG: ATP synthase F1 subunit epsilon [Paludisphaera borealis]|uniref:ATP synthase F1 subunit epsilon n=1 Tax=Paludisphaera borealis TaxID=1387353 RepID=UPI00284FAFD5|nr:ATP synthase F1 subunit epsilon [Paludisphaera borealis]MDR3617882.1 ATP synthase F1 subunit epsilon [Paludisphaera borealis]